VLITGRRWLKRWDEAGIWERIWRAAQAVLNVHGKLDWSTAFLDGSLIPPPFFCGRISEEDAAARRETR
jgi:hypothetical protein